MRSQGSKQSIFVIEGGTVSLEGKNLITLLRAVVHRGVPFRFKVKGFSMTPFLRDEDVLTVSPLSDTSLGYGDVVSFIHHVTGKLIIHRIVGRKGDYFLLRGDNSPEDDWLVPQANILGRVTRVERNGRRVLFGIGSERFLIAFLTKRGLLFPLFFTIWRIIRPLVRHNDHA